MSVPGVTYPSSSTRVVEGPPVPPEDLHGRLDELADQLDRCRAWRTVPRGADANDPRRTPGVPFDLWCRHVRYERTQAPEDLEALVAAYTPYALSLASRLHRAGEPDEDVDQVALEALVGAIRRFRTDRGRPFAALASPTITGAIKRHYRDRGWALRTPRIVHELASPLREARERLTLELDRPPATHELAAELGVDESVVGEVERGLDARTMSSLDRPLPEAPTMTLGDTLGGTDHDLDLTDDRIALADAMESLERRDREVIALYFGEELTQREIGLRYGVSQMQVSRWLASITDRLRVRMSVPV